MHLSQVGQTVGCLQTILSVGAFGSVKRLFGHGQRALLFTRFIERAEFASEFPPLRERSADIGRIVHARTLAADRPLVNPRRMALTLR